MKAFFSGKDDKDDVRNRYSIVIGNIKSLIPEMKFRFSYGSKRKDLVLDDLFIDSDNYIKSNIDSFLDNIETVKYKHISVLENSKTTKHSFNGHGHSNQKLDLYDYYSSYYDNYAINNASITVKCYRCGKFSNTSKAKLIDGGYLCAQCAEKTAEYKKSTNIIDINIKSANSIIGRGISKLCSSLVDSNKILFDYAECDDHYVEGVVVG